MIANENTIIIVLYIIHSFLFLQKYDVEYMDGLYCTKEFQYYFSYTQNDTDFFVFFSGLYINCIVALNKRFSTEWSVLAVGLN